MISPLSTTLWRPICEGEGEILRCPAVGSELKQLASLWVEGLGFRAQGFGVWGLGFRGLGV